MNNEEKLKGYIWAISDRLKSLAEDRTLPMDIKVHELLWQEIQSIEHDIETNFQEVTTGNSSLP